MFPSVGSSGAKELFSDRLPLDTLSVSVRIDYSRGKEKFANRRGQILEVKMPSKRANAMHRNSLPSSNNAPVSKILTEDGYMLDYAILPRRKAGQVNASDRCPVRLTKDVLEKYFGMPLIRASKELVSTVH